MRRSLFAPVDLPQEPPEPRYLTTKEAADLHRVSVRLIAKLIREGKIPAYRSGRRWLIAPEDLKAYRPLERVGPPEKKGKNEG